MWRLQGENLDRWTEINQPKGFSVGGSQCFEGFRRSGEFFFFAGEPLHLWVADGLADFGGKTQGTLEGDGCTANGRKWHRWVGRSWESCLCRVNCLREL